MSMWLQLFAYPVSVVRQDVEIIAAFLFSRREEKLPADQGRNVW